MYRLLRWNVPYRRVVGLIGEPPSALPDEASMVFSIYGLNLTDKVDVAQQPPPFFHLAGHTLTIVCGNELRGFYLT